MTKTYEQRLAELAEEFARARYAEGAFFEEGSLRRLIKQHKPLAAIALKHMAEEWKDGYDYGWWDKDYNSEIQLINRGLIPPQKP